MIIDRLRIEESQRLWLAADGPEAGCLRSYWLRKPLSNSAERQAMSCKPTADIGRWH